jgi:hypothetical protein
MTELDINAKWVKGVAKQATYSGMRANRGAFVVAVSVNRFDKLEEWSHEHMAPAYTTRSVWHTLMFYGVAFACDHTLEDDEVLIKENP